MKKLITILTVMIVLVGAVFAVDSNTTAAGATGTAAIDILATIEAKYPVYQLAVKTGATSQTDNVGSEGANPSATMTDTEAEKLTQENGVATVVFNIKQIADSRCNTVYTLAVTASNLFLIQETGKTARTYAAAQATEDANEIFTVNATITHALNTTDLDSHISDNSSTSSALKVSYDGVLVKADQTIGTATVQWKANTTAKAGQYQGTVTLTVTNV